MKTSKIIYILSIALITFSSCKTEKGTKKQITIDQHDPTSSFTTNFDGKIFSIPSPILTMMLIKKVSPTFHDDLLNPISKIDSYQTEFKRSLMLGVYGTDLGYSSIYKNQKNILNYLVVVEKLTSNLGLDAYFDKSFIERYQRNSENQDSMMYIVSDAFKHADLFLKKGDRQEVSALILAGGWVESMYLASQLAIETNDNKLLRRIGDQKQTLKTMISLLKENNQEKQCDELIQNLETLNLTFEKININYVYNEPETNADKHLTILKHTVSFEITNDTLLDINKQIKEIRNYITA